MQKLETGDLVLIINSIYNPDIVGYIGTVAHGEDQVSGIDKFGQVVSGPFVTVDLPGKINRHGATLWYFRRKHLLRIAPGEDLQDAAEESGCRKSAVGPLPANITALPV